jgi:hypothetical protein
MMLKKSANTKKVEVQAKAEDKESLIFAEPRP